MSKEFEDIKIISMDEKASRRTNPNLALVNIVLNLSESPPNEWTYAFIQKWKQHIYMKKRDVHITGPMLQIYCMPEELQNDHIPELKKVIAETNGVYRTYLSKKAQQKAAKDAQEAADREKLKSIKDNLKF